MPFVLRQMRGDAVFPQGFLEDCAQRICSHFSQKRYLCAKGRRSAGAVRTAAANRFNDRCHRRLAVAQQEIAARYGRGFDVAVDIANDAKRRGFEGRFANHGRQREDCVSSSLMSDINRCSMTRWMASVCGVDSTGTRIEQLASRCRIPPSKPTSAMLFAPVWLA